MDEHDWKRSCEFYKRRHLNDQEALRQLEKISQDVIRRLPKSVRLKIQNHWQSRTVVPGPGREPIPAPAYVLDTNFCGGEGLDGVTYRQAAASREQGTLFAFELIVACTAPRQVIEQLVAHEFAHAYIAALGFLPQFSPECIEEIKADCTGYPAEQIQEEATVRCLTALWGFAECSEWWFFALERCSSNPVGHFKEHLWRIEKWRRELAARL